MEELVKILETQQEAIQAAYLRRLASLGQQEQCPLKESALQKLLEAMKTLAEGDNQSLRNWAAHWVEDASSSSAPVSQWLWALGVFEAALRSQILKESSRKETLRILLAQLAEVMDQLRQVMVAEAMSRLHPSEVQTEGNQDQVSTLEPSLHRLRTPSVEPASEQARTMVSEPEPERLRAGLAEVAGEDRSLGIFAALVEEDEACICLADQHGRPFYFNRAARRVFGLDEKQSASAVRLVQLYSEESWAEFRDVAVPAVNQHGQWKGRSQLRHLPTNQLTEYETLLRLVKPSGGDRSSYLAIQHRPISEAERLEETLAESEARKHAILETSLDPIITINAAGEITEFNRAAEIVFGYPRTDVLGRTPSELLFPPSDSTRQQDRIERYLQSGEGSQLGRRMEVIARRANGELFPAEMTMTLSQEHGEPVLTFFVRDISQRKRSEEEQARYAAELERSNKELEQFAYMASHDLQEPLRKIRTFGDRLQMKCGHLLDETGLECLTRMQDAAERMQHLIDGLLTLSRVTTQGQEFVPVNLEEVVREVVRDLEAQIEKVQGRVEVGHLPTIQADPLQMRQLFQNLIANALKFHRLEEPPLVHVSGRYLRDRTQRTTHPNNKTEEFCRIVVEDNGIGFEEKYLDRIFNMFQRLHPRDVYEGTGVGLAICRKIVQRHGGTITAQSTPGKGSTFICLLPVFHRTKKEAI